MRGNPHVRFAGRAEETDPPKGRHRASARSNHTHASRLVEAGVDIKVPQELMGHEDIHLTRGLYHDFPVRADDQAQRRFRRLRRQVRDQQELGPVK